MKRNFNEEEIKENKKTKFEDEDELTQKLALSVELPLDYVPNLSIPPDSAEEYLRRVQFEAKKYQKTIVSNIKQEKFDSNITFQVEYEEFPEIDISKLNSPHPEWIEDFLLHFEQLRNVNFYYSNI